MKLNAEFKVVHISMNMEKSGNDDGELRHNIKLAAQLKPNQIKDLFSTETAFAHAVENMYRKDGELVTGDLGWVEIDREGVGVTASLKTQHGTMLEWDDGANFNKLKYRLLAGNEVEVEARLQVHLEDGQADDLNRMFGTGVTVYVKAKKSQIEDAQTRAKEAEKKQGTLDVQQEQVH